MLLGYARWAGLGESRLAELMACCGCHAWGLIRHAAQRRRQLIYIYIHSIFRNIGVDAAQRRRRLANGCLARAGGCS